MRFYANDIFLPNWRKHRRSFVTVYPLVADTLWFFSPNSLNKSLRQTQWYHQSDFDSSLSQSGQTEFFGLKNPEHNNKFCRVTPHMCIGHYCDVIMSEVASQITSPTIVYSTVYSGADQRKHQSSSSLAFVWGIHRCPVNSPHKWPVTRKMFQFDDAIMCEMKKRNHCCGVPNDLHLFSLLWFQICYKISSNIPKSFKFYMQAVFPGQTPVPPGRKYGLLTCHMTHFGQSDCWGQLTIKWPNLMKISYCWSSVFSGFQRNLFV